VILEALDGTTSKRHRLVTLGGCRLLDGSGDCLRRALREDCGRAAVLTVRGSRLPRRTEKGSYARTVRQLVKSSTDMSSSRYFIISWISSTPLNVWDYSDFLSGLELSTSFTNLIGGIVSAPLHECCAKI
jgi:hypothetical protein